MSLIKNDLRAKLLWALLSCSMIGISFHCMESPLSPVAPSSQITLEIPVANITKYFSNIQGNGISMDSKGLLIIQDGTITEMTSFKDAMPNDLTKSVESASLTFTVNNSVPMQIALQLRFIRYDSITHKSIDTSLYIPQDKTQSFLIPSGKYDTADGSTTPHDTNFTIPLSNDDMQGFNQADSMYAHFYVSKFNDLPLVKIKFTDSIRVFASGTIIYIVNKP